MHEEKRREERIALVRQPKGALHVLAGERCLRVTAVRDMSQGGIRLETDARMDVGENVQVRYQVDGIDLKVNGFVVWNSDSPVGSEDGTPGGYAVGIQLASPLLLETFL